MSLLALAWSNLLRRPARSLLTLAAIALGIAAIVALTSIAWGFEAGWQKANDARGTDLIVTRLASRNTLPAAFPEHPAADLLAAQPGVQAVAGLLSEMLTVTPDGPPVFVFGWAHGSYLWAHLRLAEGRWPEDAAARDVVVGVLATEVLGRSVGQTLDIEGETFRIVGTFESPAMMENGAVIMSLHNARHISDKPGKVNILNLKLAPGTGMTEAEAIQSVVRDKLPGFMAITSTELVQQNAVVKLSKAMSGATILIASLVGALVVFNTMLMSVSERTREVGLLLALGWHKRTVVRLIVSESILLALGGGLLGILLGSGLALGLEHLELLRGKIDAVFPPLFLLASLGLSLLLGLCGGLYPALRAAALQPAAALRHE